MISTSAEVAFAAREIGFGRTSLLRDRQFPNCAKASKDHLLTEHLETRVLLRADLAAVAAILDATGLFPPDLLPEMAEPFLSGSAADTWLVICDHDTVIGFAYSEPERLTDRTHNLLAIAVRPDRQNHGVGKRLVQAIEDRLAGRGGRVLIVETSSLDEYRGTRSFYDGLGFAREAVIREFYAAGEDKIVFWKNL